MSGGDATNTSAGAALRTADEPLRIAVIGDGPLAGRLGDGLAGRGHDVHRGPGPLPGDGPVDAVVLAPWDPVAVQPVPLVELTDEAFGAAWQQTMDDAVATFVAARERFGTDGGRIVVVVPTIALAGGRDHAHWAAAAEGLHVLAKSATRQWGPEGIVANVLAVGPAGVLADPDAAGPVSIATPALPHADPAGVLEFLCGPAAADLGGQTLVVDGGLWM